MSSFGRRAWSTYLRLARIVIAVGALLAAANMWRLVLAWRGSWDEARWTALALALGFTLIAGLLLRGAWRRSGMAGGGGRGAGG